MTRIIKKYFFFILVVIIFEGCGIYSFTGASISPDDKTVLVKYFPNRASLINPVLSQEFTEMLKDKFVSQTTLDLTDKDGDLKFEGEIVRYYTKPIAIQEGQTAGSIRLTIEIRVKFTGINNQELDFDKKFSRYADFPSNQAFSDVEDGLVTEIIEQITDDIFNESVVNW